MNEQSARDAQCVEERMSKEGRFQVELSSLKTPVWLQALLLVFRYFSGGCVEKEIWLRQ